MVTGDRDQTRRVILGAGSEFVTVKKRENSFRAAKSSNITHEICLFLMPCSQARFVLNIACGSIKDTQAQVNELYSDLEC